MTGRWLTVGRSWQPCAQWVRSRWWPTAWAAPELVAKSPAALCGARPGLKCGAVVALRRLVILVLRDRISLNQWMVPVT